MLGLRNWGPTCLRVLQQLFLGPRNKWEVCVCVPQKEKNCPSYPFRHPISHLFKSSLSLGD